jgi:hypothetical protein
LNTSTSCRRPHGGGPAGRPARTTAIPLTWRLFRLNAGVIADDDRPVTRSSPGRPRCLLALAVMLFKTLFRNDGSYGKLGVHRPRAPDRDRMAGQRWVSGSGVDLAPAFLTTRIFSDLGQDHYGMVQLNHYALGSIEGFLVKADRGRANRDLGG